MELRYRCRLKSWRPKGQKIKGSLHVYIHNLKALIKAKEAFILTILVSLQTIKIEDLWGNPAPSGRVQLLFLVVCFLCFVGGMLGYTMLGF